MKGAAYTKVTIQQFNAGSRPQIVHRLTSKYPQWKPSKFTNSGMVQIDESVLANLKVPEAKDLNRYFRVNKQLSQIADGKNSWLKLEKDGRVHGRVKSVGCRTHRMSHFYPNMAQVDKKGPSGCVEVWVPDRGDISWSAAMPPASSCGCSRHFLAIWDGGSYAEAVIHGSNADGTDAHTQGPRDLAGLYDQ